MPKQDSKAYYRLTTYAGVMLTTTLDWYCSDGISQTRGSLRRMDGVSFDLLMGFRWSRLRLSGILGDPSTNITKMHYCLRRTEEGTTNTVSQSLLPVAYVARFSLH